MSDQGKIRNVVSCFLRFENKIAVFKRSTKVHTFQQHWAVCSGSIEENETPLKCAIREIGEETKLKPNEIRLERFGRPFTVTKLSENNVKSTFNVHPFLFEIIKKKSSSSSLAAESLISIDWEHTEFKFVDPTLDKERNLLQPSVPQLWEGWDRVYVDSAYLPAMENVKNNLIDGAAPLTRDTMSILELFITERKSNLTPSILKNFVFHLVNLRPTIAAIGNTMKDLVFETIGDSNTVDIQKLLGLISSKRKFSLEGPNEIVKHLSQIISNQNQSQQQHQQQQQQQLTFATNSYSSTVVSALLQLPKAHVLVGESRPGFEGRTAALKLSSKHSVSMICDAALPACILPPKKLNGTFVGADAIIVIQKLGIFIVNKTGTLFFQMTSKLLECPFYVLADTSKIGFAEDLEEFRSHLEHAPQDDLLDETLKKANIDAINPNFECFKADLDVLKIVSEKGELSIQTILSLAEKRHNALHFLLKD